MKTRHIKAHVKRRGKQIAKRTRQFLKRLRTKMKQLSRKHKLLSRKLKKQRRQSKRKQHKRHKQHKRRVQKGGEWLMDSALNSYRAGNTSYADTKNTLQGYAPTISQDPAMQPMNYNDTIKQNLEVRNVLQ
uniref:Uncharacterized protein n=1 Tax=Megaviridae environmental sample TaxID=1737588 RepID=A0A5J6VLK1_9VIRU|nr:MAG: hypothetical protein [Megaviridae environmental sample]